MKTNKLILIFATAFLFQTTFISTAYAKKIPKIFRKCINNKYEFTCKDKLTFIKKIGINIQEDLVDFNDLRLIQEKQTGVSKGGIYEYKPDPSQVYFVKQANSYREFFASRMMNLIVGTQATPIIKIVKNKSRTTASLKLQNFYMLNQVDVTNKTILGEVLLIVAMDFLGIIDRHARNIGYVILDDNKLLMARVDFDASTDFESVVTGTHQFPKKTDPLDLKHLYVTLQSYPKDQVKNAIKKIVQIPDEQIIRIALQTWAVLSQTSSSKSLKQCLNLAKKLIKRKHAFKHALDFSKKQHDEIAAMFH